VNFSTAHSTSAAYHVSLADAPDFNYRRELSSSIIGALELGKRKIVIDCSAWRHLDFSLLSVLVRGAGAAYENAQQAEIEVVNLTGQLRANIHALRLEDQLGIHS